MNSFTLYKNYRDLFYTYRAVAPSFLRRHDFWLGAGLGLLAQGTLSPVPDIFAERRGTFYMDYLQTLVS